MDGRQDTGADARPDKQRPLIPNSGLRRRVGACAGVRLGDPTGAGGGGRARCRVWLLLASGE